MRTETGQTPERGTGMEEEVRSDKIERILGIYTKLVNGDIVNKTQEALRFHVNERSIQRDIDDIRMYLDEEASRTGFMNTVIYDREKKGYRLEQIYRMKLSNGEVLALCKILLDSRAFVKEDMTGMLDKLISNCVPKTNQQLVQDLIRNEEFHYVEPRHKSKFIDTIWELGQACHSGNIIEIDYKRIKDHSVVTRRLKPVAIMFSEYYFYLTAFIDDPNVRSDFDEKDDPFPTIYRIDRIQKLTVTGEKFHIPYRDRFEEGEFRKRIQFMYGGKLQRVKFLYRGPDIDAVLDRLPTAQVLDYDEETHTYTVTAEVFGKGIDMWIRSQGDYVEVVH